MSKGMLGDMTGLHVFHFDEIPGMPENSVILTGPKGKKVVERLEEESEEEKEQLG
ncbi:MAG: hypothetical protein ACQ5SW_08320 [Sphaerochaetaceae bacterium]